jgi:hypothetical protein
MIFLYVGFLKSRLERTPDHLKLLVSEQSFRSLDRLQCQKCARHVVSVRLERMLPQPNFSKVFDM